VLQTLFYVIVCDTGTRLGFAGIGELAELVQTLLTEADKAGRQDVVDECIGPLSSLLATLCKRMHMGAEQGMLDALIAKTQGLAGPSLRRPPANAAPADTGGARVEPAGAKRSLHTTACNCTG
jgi:hypothetical protein